MRLRAGLILFFLLSLILVVGGCRKPLAPTFDRNQAPETWITAAPLDTITYREGTVPKQTDPGFIPFRYHLYWAGSDPDGKIAGFFFAVVETLPTPIPPATSPPPLPGPKARDYRFTTKTDSTFIFSVSDEHTDRQHAFYIYAVDNQGKPDPTPAKFIFNSVDRFPPLPVIDKFITTGFVWTQDPTTLALTRVLRSDTVTSVDTFKIGAVPRKQVPVVSRIDIAWHSELTTVGNPAIGYRYKLDEPDFVNVGASTTTLSYNTGPGDAVGPGVKVFRLRAVDQAGGARIPEATRLFQMNIPPTTWIAGSDPTNPIWNQAPPAGPGVGAREKYITVSTWSFNGKAGIPVGTNGQPIDLSNVSLWSSDSAKVLPSQRTPRRNFLEIFKDPTANRDRIYLRSEGDTVNMNSWVIFFNGGFDPDSPYDVVYRSNDPQAPDSTNNPVLQIRPANGSPIGFRSRIPAYLWPLATSTIPSQTGLYPLFDPSSTFRATTIGSYWAMSQAGTAYFFARAQDGNGQLDARIGANPTLDPKTIAQTVDSTGGATPEQIALRPLIMRFFVDKAPNMSLTAAAVSPRPGQLPFTSRSIPVNLSPGASDPDPYDPASPPAAGSPSGTAFFRVQLKFRSPRRGGAPGDSVTYAPPAFDRVNITFTNNQTVSLPDSLGGTQVRVMLELCDCPQCEIVPGQGRCNYYSYLITVPAPPTPALGTADLGSGPGQAILVEKKRGER